MNLLLDSQALVWLLCGPEDLGPKAKRQIERADWVSASMASLWELAIKFAQGRFEYSPAVLMMGIGGAGISELEVSHRHIVKLPFIELPHGDPFDRMLVAQAESDHLTLLTADRMLLASPYATLDARA